MDERVAALHAQLEEQVAELGGVRCAGGGVTPTDPQNVSGPDPWQGRALLAGEVSPTASDAEATSAPAGDDVIYVAAHPAGGIGICCSLCESTLAVDAGGIVTAEEVRAIAKAHLAAVHNEGGR